MKYIWAYLGLGALLWYAVFLSVTHATLAGVVQALHTAESHTRRFRSWARVVSAPQTRARTPEAGGFLHRVGTALRKCRCLLHGRVRKRAGGASYFGVASGLNLGKLAGALGIWRFRLSPGPRKLWLLLLRTEAVQADPARLARSLQIPRRLHRPPSWCSARRSLFVKTLKTTSLDAAYNSTTFCDAWRTVIQCYGIYNAYTGRGAIKGLLPHGPHNLRDILATHILKQTGSYEQASYAIQDMPDVVQ